MKHTLLFLFSLISCVSNAQSLTKVEIDSIIKSIEENKSLSKSVFDFSELIHQTTDGGSELIVYQENKKIKKITLQVSLSYGLITSIIYLRDEEPVYLIEKEENYLVKNDTIDYSKLESKFKEIIYVFGFSPQGIGEYQFESEVFGERVLSDNYCEIDELFDLIVIAKKALEK